MPPGWPAQTASSPDRHAREELAALLDERNARRASWSSPAKKPGQKGGGRQAMHVVLAGSASVGRLRPLLFLGAELSRRGHTVTLLCPRAWASALRPLCDAHGVVLWEIESCRGEVQQAEGHWVDRAPVLSRSLTLEVSRWGAWEMKADQAVGAALRDLHVLAPVDCCVVDVASLEAAKAVRTLGFPCALHVPGASAHVDLRWLLGLVLGGDSSGVRTVLGAPYGSRAVLNALGGLREFFGACAGRTLIVSGCVSKIGAECFPRAGLTESIAAGAVFTQGDLTPPEAIRASSRWEAEKSEGSVFSLSQERRRWTWGDALEAACVAVEALLPTEEAEGMDMGGRGAKVKRRLSPAKLDAASVAMFGGLGSAFIAYLLLTSHIRRG